MSARNVAEIAPNHNYIQRLFVNDRSKRNSDEIDRSGFGGFRQKKSLPYSINGFMKKNFDEIDASGFRGFVSKKNFDEIDRSSFNDLGKRNFDEIDASGFRGFDKKNLFGSFDLDRRDLEKYQRLQFPDYFKIGRLGPRSYLKNFNSFDVARMQKKNFDEIDRSGFPGFNKRF